MRFILIILGTLAAGFISSLIGDDGDFAPFVILVSLGCLGYLIATAKDFISDYNILKNPENFDEKDREEAKGIGTASLRSVIFVILSAVLVFHSVSLSLFAIAVLSVYLVVLARDCLKIVKEEYKEKSEAPAEAETSDTPEAKEE